MSLVFDGPLLTKQLTMAATEVLETMFFASVEIPEAEAADPPGDRIGASLDFHGACTGRLVLTLERAAAQELASSFLGGFGKAGPGEDIQSVLGELTNMVCGAMLSHLDRNSIFYLATPMQLEPGQEATGEIVQDLMLEDGLLRLAFSIQESNSEAGHGQSKVEAQ